MLPENHKKKWMDAAPTFLTLCSEEASEFLDSIVTRDEREWVVHHTPESRLWLMVWRHTYSPTKKKYKTSATIKSWQLSTVLKGGSWVILHLKDHRKHCSILWNTEKAWTSNSEEKMRAADTQHLLTAQHCKSAHCESNTAVVATFHLGSFRPSCAKTRPPSQQFPFVIAFEETSLQP